MASVLDIDGILDAIKTILDSNNTTTGSPVNLSNGLSATSGEVKIIEQLNPSRMFPDFQLSEFPRMTMWVDRKSIETQAMARNQIAPKREATLSVNLAGIVVNDNMVTRVEDPADKDVEKLMENAEYILRDNPDLSGTVTWQMPIDVDYHSDRISEQTHMRVGIMTIDCKVFY